MFEARLVQGHVLRKVLDAIKDLLDQASWDCDEDGLHLQAMDSSHVTLVSVMLRSDGFDRFRCDNSFCMGVNMSTMTKILRCSAASDIITLKAREDGDVLTFMFESENQDKVSDYEMKQMNIDQEHLGIPETEYAAVVTMPSQEFQKIIRDICQFGETVVITCTKAGIQFAAAGDIGTANVKLSQYMDIEEPDQAVTIEMNEPVSLSFALRYLLAFTKATPLAPRVRLSMSPDTPLTVEYKVETMGYVRYYLAPKIDEQGDN